MDWYDFLQRTAPRAAVYEALPATLMSVDAAAAVQGVQGANWPGTGSWTGFGTEFGSSSTGDSVHGTRSEFHRSALEARTDIVDDEFLKVSVGGRIVLGSAKVVSAVGRGRINATGVGVVAGIRWSGGDGTYGSGQFSTTAYDLDISSTQYRSLANNADARVDSLRLEAGRHFAFGSREEGITARTWFRHSRISSGGFVDTTGSEVQIAGGSQSAVGIGGTFELLPGIPATGAARLRVSFGLEHMLDGDGTTVLVSGHPLRSSGGTSKFLGLEILWSESSAVRFGFGARDRGQKESGVSGATGQLVFDTKF